MEFFGVCGVDWWFPEKGGILLRKRSGIRCVVGVYRYLLLMKNRSNCVHWKNDLLFYVNFMGSFSWVIILSNLEKSGNAWVGFFLVWVRERQEVYNVVWNTFMFFLVTVNVLEKKCVQKFCIVYAKLNDLTWILTWWRRVPSYCFSFNNGVFKNEWNKLPANFNDEIAGWWNNKQKT